VSNPEGKRDSLRVGTLILNQFIHSSSSCQLLIFFTLRMPTSNQPSVTNKKVMFLSRVTQKVSSPFQALSGSPRSKPQIPIFNQTATTRVLKHPLPHSHIIRPLDIKKPKAGSRRCLRLHKLGGEKMRSTNPWQGVTSALE
jgi:hypothetical protein